VPALGREIGEGETRKENVGQTSGVKTAVPWHISCPSHLEQREFRSVVMIQKSLAVVMFLSAIVAVSCNRSGDSDSKAPALSGTTTMVRSNADLENAVKAKFKTDEQLRSADLGVSADSTHNEITLSGSVESEAMRSKAVDLAKSVDSGLTVNDQIEVKPSGRTANVLLSQQHHG
jgi:hypothetical protein